MIAASRARRWAPAARTPRDAVRRLAIRYERRADIHDAALPLAAFLICWSPVRRWFCQALLVERCSRWAACRLSCELFAFWGVTPPELRDGRGSPGARPLCCSGSTDAQGMVPA